jgi:hypothetical protein
MQVRSGNIYNSAHNSNNKINHNNNFKRKISNNDSTRNSNMPFYTAVAVQSKSVSILGTT